MFAPLQRGTVGDRAKTIGRNALSKAAGPLQTTVKPGARGTAPRSALSQDRAERKAKGVPLDATARALVEPLFRRNFSHVRVHADPEAQTSAAAMHADAYAVGEDIVFGAGNFVTSTERGRALLVHELTHVTQAQSSAISDSPALLEQEARRVVKSFEVGEPLPTIRRSASGLKTPLRNGPTFGNLPGDAPVSGLRLRLQNIGGKWYEIMPGKEARRRRAAGWYDFVVQDGEIWAEKGKGVLGHTEAARGARVTYAGQIRFTSHSGQITEWNEASGHYRPSSSFAGNANAGLPVEQQLPMDRFQTHPQRTQMVQLPTQQPAKGDVLEPRGRGGDVTRTGGKYEPVPQKTTVTGEIEAGKSADRAVVTSGTRQEASKVSDGAEERRAATVETRAASAAGSASHFELPRISVLDAAMFYLDIHAAHFAALEKVAARVEAANEILNNVDSYEEGAREIGKLVDQLRAAESQLPGDPIDALGGEGALSVADVWMLREYYAAAADITSHAFDAEVSLTKIIRGWDAALVEVDKTKDFTRKAVYEAITLLDLRFSNQGGGFRAYLTDSRDWAARVENWSRQKWKQLDEIPCVKDLNPLTYGVCLVTAVKTGVLKR